MLEDEGKKDEGLIRDRYELILRELQTVITVFYLLLVSIGMLFISSKYSAFDINIFEYADVFDFLIAPFHDVRIIYITLIMTLVPGAMIYLDRIWKEKRPEWYSKWNFGWDKKPWFNVFRVISFGGLILIFLFEGASGYGQFKKRTISLSPVIEVFYVDGTTVVGNEIGKTKEVLFLMVGDMVRIIPLASLVKEVRPLKQESMSDVMKVFDDVAKEYAERYWSVDAYEGRLNQWITSLPEGATVLDLGCGPGNYADYALRKRSDLKWKGVDFSPAMIEIAKDSVPEGEFRVADVTDGALFQEGHQGVMISFVTPYLNDKSTRWMIRRSYNSLDPGGQIYLGTIVGDKEEVKAQSSSDGESNSLLTYYRKVSTYKKWLEDTGFEIVEVETKTRDYGNESVDEAIFLARKIED